MNHRCAWVLATCLLAGCGRSDESKAIQAQLRAAGTVDLQAAVSGDWDRVCIFGPYSTDQDAAHTLGFPWSLTSSSSVWQSDGVSLLVFVRGTTVTAAIDHPRNAGDFSKLADRCFRPEQAQFIHRARRTNGWPELVPAAGA